MKTHDYSQYGVEVLTMKEAASIRGGLTWLALGGLVLMSAIMSPQAHYDAFLQGISEGYNGVKVNQ